MKTTITFNDSIDNVGTIELDKVKDIIVFQLTYYPVSIFIEFDVEELKFVSNKIESFLKNENK